MTSCSAPAVTGILVVQATEVGIMILVLSLTILGHCGDSEEVEPLSFWPGPVQLKLRLVSENFHVKMVEYQKQLWPCLWACCQ